LLQMSETLVSAGKMDMVWGEANHANPLGYRGVRTTTGKRGKKSAGESTYGYKGKFQSQSKRL